MIGKLKAGKNCPQDEREATIQHIKQERREKLRDFVRVRGHVKDETTLERWAKSSDYSSDIWGKGTRSEL
jgi:hypothetical protein